MITSFSRLRFASQWIVMILIGLLFLVLVAKPILLTASDLGRHLINGQLFLEKGTILTTNYYSYTYPDFPFFNHHWASGVLFELVRRISGFGGLSIFGLSIIFATFILYFRAAWVHGQWWLAVCASFLVVGVFASRIEIRPELFSYLLSSIFLWILLGVRARAISPHVLFVLPLLMLLWVNLHIYFFLGIGWIGAFFIDALVRTLVDKPKRSEHMQLALQLAGVLAASCIATIGNPNTWRGALYPFFIFENYAYQVAENQSVMTIVHHKIFPPIYFFFIAFGILSISWLAKIWRSYHQRVLPDIALLILSIFVSLIAWKAIRNFTIFAYVAMFVLPYTWSDIVWPATLKRWHALIQTMCIAITFAIILCIWPSYWKTMITTSRIGVAPGILRSIDFFKDNHLKGPIFNNYDIGGFLTYGLFPGERVFVDNRPEAYPAEFFTNTLLPIQMNDGIWSQRDAHYKFNTIFFFRRDATAWAQNFMMARIKDPEWAPVFVDDYVLVLVRRTPENATIIKNYELPQYIFGSKPRK